MKIRPSAHRALIAQGKRVRKQPEPDANTGLITNLPNGCTVELPCIADSNGIQPTFIGDLPSQCAATCSASVNVQKMAVEAALSGDRNLAKLAVLHDPLTGAVLTPDQVWSMCDEMLAAEAQWLPQFA